MSNYLIKCSCYCAVYCRRRACSAACTTVACCSMMRGAVPAAARCAVERSDEYLCTGGAYRNTRFIGNYFYSEYSSDFYYDDVIIVASLVLGKVLVLRTRSVCAVFCVPVFYNSPTSVKQHCDRVTRKMNVFIKQTYLNAKHCFIFTARCT